jgi:hypothetical protein
MAAKTTLRLDVFTNVTELRFPETHSGSRLTKFISSVIANVMLVQIGRDPTVVPSQLFQACASLFSLVPASRILEKVDDRRCLASNLEDRSQGKTPLSTHLPHHGPLGLEAEV